MPPLDQLLILAVLGLVFGSFGNVLVLRDDSRASILTGRSSCPRCGRVLRAYELIPVLSWVIQMGKCRGCKGRVSGWYPIGELLGMGWGVLAVFVFPGLLMPSLYLFGALWLLGVMAVIDFRSQTVLPEYAVAVGLLGALAYGTGSAGILGATIAASIILFIILLWKVTTGTDGMGVGDAWVAGALGLWFGYPLVFVALLLAVFSGTAYGVVATLVLTIQKKPTAKLALPFVPFLAVGAVVTMVWGEMLLSWYTMLMGGSLL